jgi:hypothetical protein
MINSDNAVKNANESYTSHSKFYSFLAKMLITF